MEKLLRKNRSVKFSGKVATIADFVIFDCNTK